MILFLNPLEAKKSLKKLNALNEIKNGVWENLLISRKPGLSFL
jgi:hypothetical protein